MKKELRKNKRKRLTAAEKKELSEKNAAVKKAEKDLSKAMLNLILRQTSSTAFAKSEAGYSYGTLNVFCSRLQILFHQQIP